MANIPFDIAHRESAACSRMRVMMDVKIQVRGHAFHLRLVQPNCNCVP